MTASHSLAQRLYLQLRRDGRVNAAVTPQGKDRLIQAVRYRAHGDELHLVVKRDSLAAVIGSAQPHWFTLIGYSGNVARPDGDPSHAWQQHEGKPWCDRCTASAVWSETLGWTHEGVAARDFAKNNAVTRKPLHHEVTATAWMKLYDEQHLNAGSRP